MKNYSQKTNKQMTRYRTASTFRGNVKFQQNIVKRQPDKGYDAHFHQSPISNNQSSNNY